MKRLLLLFYFFLLTLMCSAQVSHFIYIQSDSRQPFYVKLNEQIYSSASAGYLVIPKLVVGEYRLKIGFPQNEWPVQEWQLTLGNKDAGFLLKPVSDVWALIDLSDFSVQKALSKEVVTQTAGNDFANTLAQVAGDPGIGLKQKNDSDTSNQGVAILPEKRDSTALVSEPIEKYPIVSISRLLAENNKDEWRALYLISGEKETDTVEVIIPIPSEPDLKNANSNPAVVISNPACKRLASSQTMKQLISRMQKVNSMEEKIALFRSNAKQQCFSTEQMRMLALQMPTEAGKYYLLDAAYPVIADKHACASLGSLFSDPYFKNRFEAMIQL